MGGPVAFVGDALNGGACETSAGGSRMDSASVGAARTVAARAGEFRLVATTYRDGAMQRVITLAAPFSVNS